MMQNFDTELDVQGVSQMVTVRETIRVRRESADRSYLLVAPEKWSARELRSYVVGEIALRFGYEPIPAFKEHAIFASFIERWGGEMAAAMARYVFEVCDGKWLGKPVTIYRWCKNADPYFAIPLAERLSLASGA